MVAGLVFVASVAPGLAEGQILRQQGENDGPEILVTDRVARLVLRLPVEAETAYDAWIDANQLVQWLSHWAEMTVSEGESFEIGWEGYEETWSGTYLEVDRPRTLSFTWLPPAAVFPVGAYETRVTLTFEDAEGGGTLMTLEHSGFEGATEMEAQIRSWRAYLFALRAFLLQPPVEGR